jgi:hypothetical protein
MHTYEVRPRKDHRGVDLISDVLPFGRLWYDTPDHAIGYAMHSSRSHHAVIRVYDDAGNVIATHQHKSDFQERGVFACIKLRLTILRLAHSDVHSHSDAPSHYLRTSSCIHSRRRNRGY